MGQKQKIIIADDDPLLLSTVESIIDDAGYEAFTACDGDEVIRLLDTCMPDLVITDIVMPDKEGIETIMEIKKTFPAMKIIAMSGSGHQKDQYLSNAQILGADAVIAKPFTPDQLTDLVERTISG